MVNRIAYVVNPNAASGKGFRRWLKLSNALARNNISHQVVLTERIGHALELAKELSVSHDLIVAVGGDGTVHEVANGILDSNSNCALGVYPVGTGNDFATSWHLKQNIEQHVSLLHQPVYFKQDVLQIENETTKRWSISVADIGLAADVAKRINESKKSGKLVYTLAAIKSALTFTFKQLHVHTTDGIFSYDALTVAFGIHRTNGGGLCQCPNAIVNDGLVEISLTEKIKAQHIPQLLYRLYNGTFTRHSKVHAFQSDQLNIVLPTGWWMEADGEPIGEGAFTLAIEKEKLIVLAPYMPGNQDRPTSLRNGHGMAASITSNASK